MKRGTRFLVSAARTCKTETFTSPSEAPTGGYLVELHASLISPGTEMLMFRDRLVGSTLPPPTELAYRAMTAWNESIEFSRHEVCPAAGLRT